MTYQDFSKPPFRADHVGSLLRPTHLHEAREKFASGDLSSNDLRQIEDKCIIEVIEKQEATGINAITDGEFRRTSWHYDFLCSLEGIEQTAPPQGPAFKMGHQVNSLSISNKITNPGGVMLDHFRFLKETTKATPKFCIPSPSLA